MITHSQLSQVDEHVAAWESLPAAEHTDYWKKAMEMQGDLNRKATMHRAFLLFVFERLNASGGFNARCSPDLHQDNEKKI